MSSETSAKVIIPAGRIDPFEQSIPNLQVSSELLGWKQLKAARVSLSGREMIQPPLTHHALVLFLHPPEKLEVRYAGVKRQTAPFAGTVSVVPAGSSVGWRWKGRKDSLHVYLPPELISRVASEAFDLDSNRLPTPSLDCLDASQLRTAMLAVENELLAQGMGGPLAAESLANMLAVYLIRHLLAPARLPSGPYGILPPKRLRAVVEYIMENLESKLTLEQLAAVTHLSPYHFARLFKATTGLAPHHYVIVRRVERAKHLLQQKGADLSMVEVALRVGFSDQSQFTHHFKRIVGATPGQFRNSARIA